MNKINRVLLATFLMASAGAASAYGVTGSAEALQQSAEMNKPQVAAPMQARTTGGKPIAMSQADRRADDVIRNTDMMKSPTFGSSTGMNATPAPLSEDARKVAETMTRTDAMKPN
jgi:hypothetical protein